MKTWSKFGAGALVAGALILRSEIGMAQTAEQISAAKEILAKAPAAELAAQAAELVAKAPVKTRASVASAVGQAAASINPDGAVAAVKAVALRVPDSAAAVAAGAAVKLPNLAPTIAVAAARVTGVKARDVRTAVIAAVPAQAAQIISALSRADLNSSLDPAPTGKVVAASGVLPDTGDKGVL